MVSTIVLSSIIHQTRILSRISHHLQKNLLTKRSTFISMEFFIYIIENPRRKRNESMSKNLSSFRIVPIAHNVRIKYIYRNYVKAGSMIVHREEFVRLYRRYLYINAINERVYRIISVHESKKSVFAQVFYIFFIIFLFSFNYTDKIWCNKHENVIYISIYVWKFYVLFSRLKKGRPNFEWRFFFVYNFFRIFFRTFSFQHHVVIVHLLYYNFILSLYMLVERIVVGNGGMKKKIEIVLKKEKRFLLYYTFFIQHYILFFILNLTLFLWL